MRRGPLACFCGRGGGTDSAEHAGDPGAVAEGDWGRGVSLAEALRGNATLQKLDLGNCEGSAASDTNLVGEEGARALAPGPVRDN